MTDLRNDMAKIIGIQTPDPTSLIEYRVLESTKEDGYTRQLIEYDSNGDPVIAFLLLPEILDNNPGILINHQHNSERHWGKSEVCGLAGNPLQAFGPALAKKGFVVLAPDSLCFEDRRIGARGIEPQPGDLDFLQHYNEMCYRLVKGEYLMKKVLEDAMNGITLLSNLPYVDNSRIGTLGHSYGGTTVLFLSAFDERIVYSCASGSACTYADRMRNHVKIENASVIPGFNSKYEIYDLVSCIAPRKLLIVSAEEDKFSRDASYVVEMASGAYAKLGVSENLQHKKYPGNHPLTQERFDYIVNWVMANGNPAGK